MQLYWTDRLAGPRRFVWAMIVTTLLLAIVGCSRGDRLETAPVHGKVTYKGEPLHIGSLLFVPVGDGPSAQGEIDRDGSYVMGTYGHHDGAVLGEHKVIITALTSPGGSGLPEDAVDPNAGPVSVTPERYGDLEKSGLRATVKADTDNEIDFTLTDEEAGYSEGG